MKTKSIKEQFKALTNFFERENLDYAVIGAFALYAYGYTRATRDVDFITRSEYQKKIIDYLESLGFETLNRSEGYSNHLHPVGSVRIDLVYIGGETANIVFASTEKKIVLENLELPVVSPEHLIALKLFAVQNDPDRRYKELADIKEILRLTNLDIAAVRALFKKYGMEEYCDEITNGKNKD
ncbi:MAG: nucleotidyl transferase AbiEii/AbiGii toxin family protein [bacterium]|nr:nucleotidyl transferase AbiEii/AbiGii toxin family protein [bacterium]